MRLLGIDTSSSGSSVAITDGDVILASAKSESCKPSRDLLSILIKTFDKAGCRFDDIDAIGVAHGPGSFTGLRIGIGTALGLSDGSAKKVVGVGALDAMARSVDGVEGDYIIPILACKKGEIYTAIYLCEGGFAKKLTGDLAVPPASLASMIDKPARITGDIFHLYEDEIRSGAKEKIEYIKPHDGFALAEEVAQMANEKINDDDFGVSAVYARRCEAEINWEKK